MAGIITISDVDPDEVQKIVSAAELRANLRISNVKEDAIAQNCILAAYDWLANPENGWLNRAILTQQYQLALPGFQREEIYSNNGVPMKRWVPTSAIVIPKPPLVSVQSVSYSAAGADTTLDPSSYQVNKSGLFGNISLTYGKTWPAVDAGEESVRIAFTAGYGDGATVRAKCPGIRQALILLAGDAFRNREDTYAEPRLVAVNRKIINGVQRFAGRYRIMNAHA